MTHFRQILRIALGTLVICSASAPADEAHTAHRIVARSALNGLSPELRPIFEAHRDAFVSSAVEPGTTWARNRKMSRRRKWHDVQVDATAEEQHLDARIQAFDAFPRNERDAQRLYRRSSGRNGGRLPWAIAETHDLLIDAFRTGDATLTVQIAGHLAHFATDAANPFRVTSNHDGEQTGNPRFGSPRGVHPADASSVRERFGVALFARNMADYEQHLHVTYEQSRQYSEPLQAAFALIELSIGAVDHIARVDRDALAALGITDEASFATHRTAYLDVLDEECGDIAVSQLSAAAATTAQLINAAWTTAGKPAVGTTDSNASAPSDTPSNPTNAADGAFIGSKNSNVFHKRGCRFAKQIAPDNFVSFTSSASAKSAGRRACRVCKPD